MSIPDACLKCKLYQQGCKTHLMSGHGSDNPDIIFLGEAPGSEEDTQGIPFIGRSGQLLRNSIADVDLPIDKIRFTNVVRCRPPENRTPTAKEVKSCLPFLTEEIESCKPKVVVLLGNTPLKAVLGLNGISDYQGQGAIERDGIKYVPMYHPSYILRQGASQTAMEDWLRSMGDIINAYEDATKPEAADAHYEYLFPMYLEDLEQMRDELLADPDELIACDIESVSLRIDMPGNKIITIAFANSKKAWSFPVDHKDSWWTEEERVIVVQIIADVLTKGRIINHNIKFDCKMIRHFLDIDFVPVGDTIQLSRLVSPDVKEHGLKRLAGIHLGMFDYNAELEAYIAEHPECDYDRGGNYGNVPLEILLPYGGKDVSATRMLHDKLYAQLTPKQCVLYEQMIILADYAIGMIEENGFKIDYWLVERCRAVYQAVMDNKYMPAMLADKDLKLFVQSQDTYLKLEKAKMLTKTKDGKKYVCELTWPDGTKWKFDKVDWLHHYKKHLDKFQELQLPELRRGFEFNPGSQDQVVPILFELKGMKPEGFTPGGQPSVKRDLLKKVIFNIKEAGKKVDPFLLDYMDWKLLRTINTKTFQAMQDSGNKVWHSNDGRVRSTYTLGGAKTGRTSSAQPNLQNIPAVEKEPGTVLQYLPAKNVFTHTFPGGGLAMLDYSGMELRVMCSIANIQGMIDVFNRKGDVHRYVSSLIYKKPEDQITKDERYRGKWSNWSLLYLGGAHTLYRLYSHLGLTKSEAEFIADMYYKEFPELGQYHKRTIAFVDEYGYVESAFGRVLPLPGVKSDNKVEREDAYRTAVNMPIQGVASDTLMVALAIIVQLMRGKGYRSMFVNTVHDSLVLDYHPDERDELVKLSIDVMENITSYAAEYMPGLDFSWLRVPLVADAEFGTNYGSYGWAESFTCECGSTMTYAADACEVKRLAVELVCYACGARIVKEVKPITYNAIHTTAVAMRNKWQQVLYNNTYNGPRQPRLNL